MRCSARRRLDPRAGRRSRRLSSSADASPAGLPRRCGSSTSAARPATRSRRRSWPTSARSPTDGGKAIAAAQPARHRAGAPLPGVRRDDSLPELRRRARAASRRNACDAITAATTSPLPRRVRRYRVGRARPARRRDAEAPERELAPRVPELEIIRLDADDDREAGGADGRAAAFRRRPGPLDPRRHAEMVAKGHHFAGVKSSPPVIDADSALGLPDFRAEERTFALITQLAGGRSGCATRPAASSSRPTSPTRARSRFAARHDVSRHSDEELVRRRELGYPPYSHLVSIVVLGPGARSRRCAPSRSCAPGSPTPSCSKAGAAAATPRPLPAPNSSRRRTARARSPYRPRACSPPLLPLCAVPGLAAVVDVDPQSL